MNEKQPRLVTPDDVAMVRALATWSTSCRKLLGLSQQDVANQCGRSQGAISRVESGHCCATPLVTYRAIARLYSGLGLLTETPLPAIGALLGTADAMTVDVDPLRKALLAAFDACAPSRRAGLVDCVQQIVGLTQWPCRAPDLEPDAVPPSVGA